MLESVAAAEPGDKLTRRLLALAYERIGDVLSTYGKEHGESLAMHRKALTLEESLLKQDPQNTSLRRLKARETVDIGDELRAQGDTAAALDKYREGLNSLRTLSLADPKSVQFHTDVGNVRTKIGDALLESGKAQAALTELQGALSELSVDDVPMMALTEFESPKPMNC